MQARCSVIFLACTAILGLNLLVEEVLRIDETAGQDQVSGQEPGAAGQDPLAPRVPGVLTELFVGQYVFRANGTKLAEGVARLALGSRQTSAMGVQLSSVSIVLVGGNVPKSEWEEAQDVEFLLAGVELSGARELAASGLADPSTLGLGAASPCHLDAVVSILGQRPQSESGSSEQRELAGGVSSADCGFSFELKAEAVDLQQAGQKAVHYALWANFLTVVQMRCFISQMRHTDEGSSAGKLSLVAMAIQAWIDAYDALLHLGMSASSRHLFNKFGFVALPKFMLFALLEFRYLLAIWRQRNREIFAEGWDAVRRELSRVYSRFYFGLVGGLLLIFNYMQYLDIMVLVAQAHWLPQILHDVRQGSRSALELHFIVGISATRCLQVLYLWGCPQGIFDGTLYAKLPHAPSPGLCAGVVLLQGAQVAVMWSQKVLGPRWFVPWLCLPHVYNYRRPVEVAPGSDCVICMAELDEEEGQQIAATPCDHRFHRACLEKWMDVKMECPTCRAELPPIY